MQSQRHGSILVFVHNLKFFVFKFKLLQNLVPQLYTADGDCIHEIKRHLLLGRKVMTHLDSILNNRDITLSTKVHLVKVMVFLVVMYGCESWTIESAEEWTFSNCGAGEYS